MNSVSSDDQIVRRKRLGQFFSGDRLAHLLAALANAQDSRSVIDPMAGSGDMLAACCRSGSRVTSLVGIEIDPGVAAICRARIATDTPRHNVITGSAFDPRSWSDIPSQFDLVITNPPYVRYQIGSATADGAFEIPSAHDIRIALISSLECTTSLVPEDRRVFIDCAQHYSGLADLAVPSWILCCARVALDGRLAIVTPNTWLSRDYSSPVVYLLKRFFEIEYVAEDSSASWFPEAQTRTTLIVARRVADRGSPYQSVGHLQITIPAGLADERSLVGGFFQDVPRPDEAFAIWAATKRSKKESGESAGLQYSWSDGHDLLRLLRHAARRDKWLPPDISSRTSASLIPEKIRRIIPAEFSNLQSLESLGWSVGQGLRTGGNDFFYVSKLPGEDRFVSGLVPNAQLSLPPNAMRPAVRRQSELLDSNRRVVLNPVSFVLVLGDWALLADAQSALGPRPWHIMDGDLAHLVHTASTCTYRRGSHSVAIPALTAIRTNVRSGNRQRSARFWYQLPDLAPRHTPDIFLARVNGAETRPYINVNRSLVVDANFSTLWASAPNAIPAPVMLALLSSAWTRAFLEASGTVMGGGALKVEATHLRQLVVPTPGEAAILALSELGANWYAGPVQFDVQAAVDDVLASIVGDCSSGLRLAAFAREQAKLRSL